MAHLPLPIKPFPVPETVVLELPPGRRQDGMQALPQIQLKDLPDEVLAELIEEFTQRVMALARPTSNPT